MEYFGKNKQEMVKAPIGKERKVTITKIGEDNVSIPATIIANKSIQKAEQGDIEGARHIIHSNAPHPNLKRIGTGTMNIVSIDYEALSKLLPQPTKCYTCDEEYEDMSGWCKCTRPIKVECKCTCCGAHYDDYIEADCVGTERPVRTTCIDCSCPATPCNHPPYKGD